MVKTLLWTLVAVIIGGSIFLSWGLATEREYTVQPTKVFVKDVYMDEDGWYTICINPKDERTILMKGILGVINEYVVIGYDTKTERYIIN